MNKFMVYSALAIVLIAKGFLCAPICAQENSVQTMTLASLYDLADRQSQKVRVSEVALQAAKEGVAAAKSALLPSHYRNVLKHPVSNAVLHETVFSCNHILCVHTCHQCQ